MTTAPVALLKASRYALPGYGDRRVWCLPCTYLVRPCLEVNPQWQSL